MANKTGKAYAFFNCEASKRAIERKVRFIRRHVKTPNELELSLMRCTDSLTGDSQLLQVAKEADRKYVMEATYPNATNHQTADEVAAIMIPVYQSSLCTDKEQFRCEIVYKDRGRYVSRE